MKTKIIICFLVLMLSAFAGRASGYKEDASSNFFGTSAGASVTSGTGDTFIGGYAGYANTTGYQNTFIGYVAGCD